MPDLTIETCYCCKNVDDAITMRTYVADGCDWIEAYSDELYLDDKKCPKCGGEVSTYRYGA